MRVGIVAKRGDARAASLADEVRRVLPSDVEVWVDETTAEELAAVPGDRGDATDGDGDDGEGEGEAASDVAGGVASRPIAEMGGCDLVVSIGGDGTFLLASRGAGSTPVVGVNLGEVGFLNAVAPEEATSVVRREVERFRETGAVGAREFTRVRASGDGWALPPSLNEVAVLGPRRGPGDGIGIEVRVDGDLYAGGHADGVLVATPVGSTAYNLSEGGPLVGPGVDALVVTEMVSTAPMPSLVVGADREVTVAVTGADRAVVVGDGRSRQEVTPPARVTVTAADEPARVAGPPLEFFSALGKLE